MHVKYLPESHVTCVNIIALLITASPKLVGSIKRAIPKSATNFSGLNSLRHLGHDVPWQLFLVKPGLEAHLFEFVVDFTDPVVVLSSNLVPTPIVGQEEICHLLCALFIDQEVWHLPIETSFWIIAMLGNISQTWTNDFMTLLYEPKYFSIDLFYSLGTVNAF